MDFDPDMTEPLKEKKIKVVLCEPGKIARVAEIGTELSDLQRVVGGLIEPYYPFEEQVCIVCNDEGSYNGMMSQPFLYTPWRKEHKDLAAIKVGDLVLTPGINMKAIQHFYDAIRKAFFKSEEYNWRWYKFRNRSEYVTYLRKHEEAE